MSVSLVNAGLGNLIVAEKVVAVISPASAPAKRLKDMARDENRLIDITQGRRTRSILVTVSNHVILSSLQVETLAGRIHQAEPAHKALETSS